MSKDNTESKSESIKNEPSAPVIISKGAAHKSRHLHLSKFKVAIWPAIIGFLSAVLLIGIIAAYYWGTNVSANSSNYSNITQAWGTILEATSILFALVVAIILPIWWGRFKSNRRALASLAFEVIFLGLAVLISGFILFHGYNGGSNTGGINPGGGCGCGGLGGYGAQICCDQAN
jgi:hypothetical protein